MQDCEQVSDSLPIRQGDVLKRVRPADDPVMVIVMTADCDIANNKLGDAGLACVQLVPLGEYMLREHASALAKRQFKKRIEKLTEWINRRWQQVDAQNTLLSEERIRSWIQDATVEEIERVLNLPAEEKASFVRREVDALAVARQHIELGDGRYCSLDALRSLQSKQVSRVEQLKTLFSTLDPGDLPLDMFFLSTVPGEPGVGFVAKLRALSFIPVDRSFSSMSAAKEHDAGVRAGRSSRVDVSTWAGTAVRNAFRSNRVPGGLRGGQRNGVCCGCRGHLR